MKTTGFLGLPAQIQELVLKGLDAEVKATEARIQEAERSRPVDLAHLGSLKGDLTRVEALRSSLTSGQA